MVADGSNGPSPFSLPLHKIALESPRIFLKAKGFNIFCHFPIRKGCLLFKFPSYGAAYFENTRAQKCFYKSGANLVFLLVLTCLNGRFFGRAEKVALKHKSIF